ncbi:hypothetical protein Pan97_51120 [Bremerella volcania]|uniref:Uncharacterized protein n=1 Tax=Bremerella volcania TaxID=2527984 RepID=A0A518CFM7_9BACT|nr:hypothetical protein [Bremerella volcania]QDU78032.1 hypothetical protein Pan97_51120 [Bremerella volcania]
MNDEQRAAIEKWRKRQIYCVAVGNLAAIIFLMGIALGSNLILGIGGAAFLVCLGGILVGGYFAHRIANSSSL